MNNIQKGRSPFYPGQPVPIDFFGGRLKEIKRITRALDQVALGKPQAVFLTGEYGIGKSSLASLMKYYAEQKNSLLAIYVLLSGTETLKDVAAKTVESALKTDAYEPTITEKVRNSLSKYVGKQELFGININFKALQADAPSLSRGYLPFLNQLMKRVEENGIKGLMLVFDEINGITGNPKFSHFIKGLVDENAISRNPLPLMLMLCGVEERRKEMIQHHQPIERIFDVVNISPMNENEMKEFFTKTFSSVGMTVDPDALSTLCFYSAGFPKIMHIIGDAVFWFDKDNVVSKEDALQGVIIAAGEIGAKFVDQQVFKALRSKDYHSILKKIGREELGGEGFTFSFRKNDIERGLSSDEKRKFNNFLQRMKKLRVLKSGEERGMYEFTNRLVRIYIHLSLSSKFVRLGR